MSLVTNPPQSEAVSFESVLSDLDDFAPMPGTNTVITPSETATRPSIFSKEATFDLSSIEEDTVPAAAPQTPPATQTPPASQTPPITQTPVDPATAEDTNQLLNALGDETDDDETDAGGTTPKTGRRKTDKSGLVSVVDKLIAAGKLSPFEDEKALADYTEADFEELIQVNIDEAIRRAQEETPRQFFDSLPAELQSAAEYAANGGTDMKSMFRVLAQVEDVKALDPAKEPDQIAIVRRYLQHTEFGSADEIDEQIQEYQDLKTLDKVASRYKPKLDKLESDNVTATLAKQEQLRNQQVELRNQYITNIYETLKPGKIGDLQLDKKTQEELYTELTTAKYQSMSGRPTNKLGHLLEKYQWSDKAEERNLSLIVEATMLLSDPEAYRQRIREQGAQDNQQKTIRTLKTEQGRSAQTTTPTVESAAPAPKASRGLPRQQRSIFSR